MSDQPPRSRRALRLAALDRALAQQPDTIATRYERASLLREAGRTDDAKRYPSGVLLGGPPPPVKGAQ